MTKARGKLIVFEGSDGSGKTTQAKLLLNLLKKKKISTVYISFPRYEKSMWGKMVRRYLDGDFGNDPDPYLISTLYAGDRMTAAPQLRKWLSEGKVVVANRYAPSSLCHMAAKFKKGPAREKYMKWQQHLEYKENGIPNEDMVVYLRVPANVSQKLMKVRKLDLHEKDKKYMEESFAIYEMVSKKKKNWVRVECSNDGKILPPGKIHKEVVEAVSSLI
ncbi:MAG: hypothetical protein NUV69_01135 [Candidatus Curtissbacteria bacterium]|nr:hypothetical protein [Candidatus Curtissbacteria bacterium]